MKGQKDKTGIIVKGSKHLILFILGIAICTCIDPYNPNIRGKGSLLVVDALLTNESTSCTVKLSRTTPRQNDKPDMVSGAYVSVTDQSGTESELTETSNGIYTSDSLIFRGQSGNSYTLNLRTSEGTEYRSESCIMYPVSKIDNIYFARDQQIINNNTEILDGIRIFMDSENHTGGKYFRWTYDEWWKFSVPNPKEYNYIDPNTITGVDTVKQVCYAHNGSSEILIHTTESSQSDRIVKEPILFVGSATSDRLLMQYSVNIKQLSISPSEYQFWEQLKEVNENGGNIFDKQPFSIVGNIHNVNDPSETVLGYFQVSSVEEKRIYVIPADLKSLNLPVYEYDCNRIELGPSDYPPDARMTFDKIYDSYTSMGFIFVSGVYDIGDEPRETGLHKSPVRTVHFTGQPE